VTGKAGAAPPGPSLTVVYRWYALGLLALINLLNIVDVLC